MIGRLEMYWQGEWGTVCAKKFGMAEAHVACRQLGFGYASSYSFNQRCFYVQSDCYTRVCAVLLKGNIALACLSNAQYSKLATLQ